MKKANLAISFLFCLVLCPLWAQNQEGSVAIAGAIRPDKDVVTADFTDCVAKLVTSGLKAEKAVGACTKIAKIATNVTTRVANEAADATKASRPMVVMGGYGYGYRNYGYGIGYGYSGSYGYNRRPVVVRRSPPRNRR